MKKTLFTLLTAINLAFLYCPAVAVFALIKDETASRPWARKVRMQSPAICSCGFCARLPF